MYTGKECYEFKTRQTSINWDLFRFLENIIFAPAAYLPASWLMIFPTLHNRVQTTITQIC